MSGPTSLVLQSRCFSKPNPTAKPVKLLSDEIFLPKKPTSLVLIIKCAAFRQANGHQLGMGDCFREEGPVQLHEGNVMVAFVQHFWLVSLVDNNLFNTPGTIFQHWRDKKRRIILNRDDPPLTWSQTSLLDSWITCTGFYQHVLFHFRLLETNIV